MSGGSHSDGAGVLGASIAVGTGIGVLPNTAGNSLMQYLSLAIIVLGGLLLLTTGARLAAKLFYKR